jgi:murein DD-endopeptidase MepM/ murein hydrolase activator NlpD
MRTHPIKKAKKMHKGIDIKAKFGTEVIAPSDATVIDSGYDKLNGYFIELKHDDTYSTRYHHLSKVSVENNVKITKGQIIGEIGTSGLSTAPHLHYEVIKEGKHVDPAPYLNSEKR